MEKTWHVSLTPNTLWMLSQFFFCEIPKTNLGWWMVWATLEMIKSNKIYRVRKAEIVGDKLQMFLDYYNCNSMYDRFLDHAYLGFSLFHFAIFLLPSGTHLFSLWMEKKKKPSNLFSLLGPVWQFTIKVYRHMFIV